MMKIAIAAAVYYPMINGVAVFSHNLAVGLAARGHEVMVLCPSQTGKAHVEAQDGVKVVYLKAQELKLYPDQIHKPVKKTRLTVGNWQLKIGYQHGFRIALSPGKAVAVALEEFRPDVVHVQVQDLIGQAAVRWARQNGTPVVSTEHNQPEVLVRPLGVPKALARPIEAALSAYFVHRQNLSDFATMPTQDAIKNLIMTQGKEFKVPVAAVSNGVDLSNFKPGKAPAEIYKKYGLDAKARTVLYIGRVDPEKRVDLVLEAYARMARRDNERVSENAPQDEGQRKTATQMVIVGDGVAKAKLQQQAKRLGIAHEVHFLGRAVPPELYELYKVGDVFATASEIETQGIVLIEAAATGLPLIAVDKGAVREVCQNERNGYLCRPGDVEQMSEAMAKILGDTKLRKKFSENSLKIAAEHDFEHTLEQFENIYARVVKGKGTP